MGEIDRTRRSGDPCVLAIRAARDDLVPVIYGRTYLLHYWRHCLQYLFRAMANRINHESPEVRQAIAPGKFSEAHCLNVKDQATVC